MRIDPYGLTYPLHRASGISPLACQHAEEVERVKMSRRASQDLPVDDFGLIQLSTLVKCQSLLQPDFEPGGSDIETSPLLG